MTSKTADDSTLHRRASRPASRGHFLTIDDLPADSLERCLKLAARCKRSPTLGRRVLAGKTLALIFQKPSIRTRVSFEVAVASLGGSCIYLAPDDIQLDKREPVKDVARTLSRYVAGIIARTFGHEQLEEFARYATIPVINALSDRHHPCQALADLLTIQERFGRLKGITISYIGDGNNVLHALAQGASRLGAHLRVATPDAYQPDRTIWRRAVEQAKATGARLTWTDQPTAAVEGADVIYTDVWTSMGQEEECERRRDAFRGFQVTPQLVARAKARCIVMHCLPAHRGEEIAEEVLEGPHSVVFDQAENRLHAQKALLLLMLGGRALA